MQLWVFSPVEHTLVGLLDEYDELKISHKCIQPGEIQVTCALTPISKRITTDSLIWPQGDETAFLVTTVIVSTNDTGKETVNIRGNCLKWLLKKRWMKVSKIFQGKSGAVMNQILADVFSEAKRRFPRFTYDIPATLGSSISIETGQDDVYSLFEDICEADGLSMGVSFEPISREMQLWVRTETDHSIGNGKVNVVAFDDEQETIQNLEYTDSVTDFKNVMYIADSTGAVLEAGATTLEGFERDEQAMMDSGGKVVTNANGTTTTLTTAQYNEKKLSEARKLLGRKKRVQSAEGDTATSNLLLVYGRDFMLGDIVTVKKAAWSVMVNMRVVEEATKQGKSSTTQTLTIGSPLPTLAERIKRK